jgi:hypothetical protein
LSKIQEISDYKKPSDHGAALSKSCWIVKPDILEKFQLAALEIPNNWEYILELPSKASAAVSGTPTVGEGGPETPCDTPKSDRSAPGTPASGIKSKAAPSSLITKFTKVLSEEERQIKFLPPKPAPTATPPTATESPSPQAAAESKTKCQCYITFLFVTDGGVDILG